VWRRSRECALLILSFPGCSCLLLAAPGCSWLLLAAPGCSRLLLAASGCSWLVSLLLMTTVDLKKTGCLGSSAGIVVVVLVVLVVLVALVGLVVLTVLESLIVENILHALSAWNQPASKLVRFEPNRSSPGGG
jgi:hypothetical protein